MKKDVLNGTPIPYNLSILELKEMISSPVMTDFSLACEALSYRADPEAYEVMKSYIEDKDKYRKLYILKTIFRHRQAAELVDFLESAINSDDFLFASSGLAVVAEHGIKISDESILSAVKKHLSKLYTEINALSMLDICEGNYSELTKLFNSSTTCAQKEFLCEIMLEKYLPDKAKEFFEMCRRDEFAKIRLLAVKVGKEYGFDISDFSTDRDGHVRKYANNHGI